MDVRLERLTKDREPDFLAMMARDEHGSYCWCVAWWVPTWEEYADSTSEANRAVRETLFADGVHDGYLAYVDGAPVGWAQVGPRDRLPKLVEAFALQPDDEAWAITCLTVLAPYRGQGLARQVFSGVLEDLRRRGVRAVEGFPRRGDDLEAEEAWTGPESLYVSAGFAEVSRGPSRSVYRLELST